MDSPPPNHLNDGCPPSLKEFILRVPNVTDLRLYEQCDKGTIQCIASNFKNLKTLSVSYFNESMFRGVKFPNLTSLTICTVEDDVNWDEFTLSNPHITELALQDFAPYGSWKAKDINKLIEDVTRNLKLQTLKIRSAFHAKKRFYDIIRKNCPEMKILDLHTFCALESNIMDGIPGLRFHESPFSFYKLSFWNNYDYDGRLPEIDRGDGNWNLNFMDGFDMVLDLYEGQYIEEPDGFSDDDNDIYYYLSDDVDEVSD